MKLFVMICTFCIVSAKSDTFKYKTKNIESDVDSLAEVRHTLERIEEFRLFSNHCVKKEDEKITAALDVMNKTLLECQIKETDVLNSQSNPYLKEHPDKCVQDAVGVALVKLNRVLTSIADCIASGHFRYTRQTMMDESNSQQEIEAVLKEIEEFRQLSKLCVEKEDEKIAAALDVMNKTLLQCKRKNIEMSITQSIPHVGGKTDYCVQDAINSALVKLHQVCTSISDCIASGHFRYTGQNLEI